MDHLLTAPASRRQSFLLVGAATLLILLTRIPSHGLPSEELRNTDEFLMLYSSMAPYMGVTATWQGWPGGGMRLAMMVIAPLTYLIDCRFKPSSDGWVLFLADYIGEWNRALAQMRWISTVAVSLGFAFLTLPIRRLSGSWLFGLFGAITASSVTAVWQRSVMATADGIAFGLLAASLSLALTSSRNRRSVLLAGLLLGAALGTKITTAFVAPTILLSVFFSTPAGPLSTRLRTAAVFCTAATVALLLVDPYLLTDPIRSTKSMVGNLLYRRTSGSVIDGILIGISPWLAILGVAGWVACLVGRLWGLWIAAGTSLGLTAAIIARSTQIDPHYFAPLAPLLAVLAFGALPRALPSRWQATWQGRGHPGAALVCVALSIAACFAGYRMDRALMKTRMIYCEPGRWSAALANQLPPGSRAALPGDADHFIRIPRSSQSVRQALEAQVRSLYAGESRMEFFRAHNLPQRLYAGLPGNFTENEHMTIALYQLALQRSSDAAADLTFWPADAQRDSASSQIEQLISDFREGKLDLLIVDQPVEGLSPLAEFAGGAPAVRRYAYAKPDLAARLVKTF